MSFVGRGNEKDRPLVGGGMRKTRDSREWKCEWALQGGGMRKTDSWEWEWQNTEWGSIPLTVLIGNRD